MKNKFKRIIVTAVSVLSIGMLPLSGSTLPAPCPAEPFESENSEKPVGGNGCEPLSDEPEIDYIKD